MARSKRNISEIALCNKWKYFITLTFNKEVIDRYNKDLVVKEIRYWFKEYIYNSDLNIKYLLVPELHKDGAVHFHGLLSDIPDDDLELFTFKTGPKYIRQLISQGEIIYNWKTFPFGFNSVSLIKDPVAVSFYVLKYISKDLAIDECYKNAYFCSKGLQRALKIDEFQAGHDIMFNVSDYYSNEYCCIGYLDSIEEINKIIEERR